jgi:hypothetical protein
VLATAIEACSELSDTLFADDGRTRGNLPQMTTLSFMAAFSRSNPPEFLSRRPAVLNPPLTGGFFFAETAPARERICGPEPMSDTGQTVARGNYIIEPLQYYALSFFAGFCFCARV